MSLANKFANILAAGFLLGGFLFAQSSTPSSESSSKQKSTQPATPKKAPVIPSSKPSTISWRSECSKLGEFCIQVPKDWKSLATVFDGAGFVVAEPDPKKPQEDWNQITAAVTDMPEPPAGKDRPSTDDLINLVLGAPAEGIRSETMQRSRTMIGGMPGEIVKVRLRATDGSSDSIEFVALLDGGESVYSVALGCDPKDVDRLEPLFQHSLHSWKAATPAPSPAVPPQ